MVDPIEETETHGVRAAFEMSEERGRRLGRGRLAEGDAGDAEDGHGDEG